jgi:hypothetical protein
MSWLGSSKKFVAWEVHVGWSIPPSHAFKPCLPKFTMPQAISPTCLLCPPVYHISMILSLAIAYHQIIWLQYHSQTLRWVWDGGGQGAKHTRWLPPENSPKRNTVWLSRLQIWNINGVFACAVPTTVIYQDCCTRSGLTPVSDVTTSANMR